jgi:hypothetical protein
MHAEANGLAIDRMATWDEASITNQGSETALVLVARVGEASGSG